MIRWQYNSRLNCIPAMYCIKGEREKDREVVEISTLSTLSFTALSKVWFHVVVPVNCY